jgi:pimeloyl-ACP methyl ester carboxylesterase
MTTLVSELVLSIHGVECEGEWQLRITPELGGIDGLVHYPHVYGQFRFWKVLRPSSRERQINALYVLLDQLQKQYDGVRPSVIAHSFGTYLVSRVLATYPSVDLDRVILCGSIVDSRFDWAGLIANGRVRKVRNEVAGKDPVVRLFRFRLMRRLVPHTGPTGVDRFTTKAEGFEQQSFPQFKHSSHFVADAHCRKYWIPFLRQTRAFRDLCAACHDSTHPAHAKAQAEFAALYDAQIRHAVTVMFRERSEAQWSDYVELIREDILREGENGKRTFDELLDRYVRALRKLLKNVP